MIRLLRRFLKKDAHLVAANVFFVAAQIAIQTFLVMQEMKNIIDRGVELRDMDFIYRSGGRMLLFTLLTCLCTVIASWLSARITAHLACRMRAECYRKVVSMPTALFAQYGESTLMMRTIADATQIQTLTINLMRTSLMVPIIIVCMLVLIFRMNHVIFLILLGVFVLTAAVLIFLGARSTRLFDLAQRKIDRISLLMKENITGARTIRAFSREDLEAEKMEAASEEAYRAAVLANRRICFLTPLSMILMNWAVVFIYAAAGSQLRARLVSISDLLLVFQYLGYFISCLAVIPVLVDLLPRASVSARRINEILDLDTEDSPPRAVSREGDAAGEIVLSHVTFGYHGAKNALTDVSFTARAGETTAIIGATGSGKTTLLALLMGFYAPDSGEIRMDGCPGLSYAPQRAQVFQDTLRNNIIAYSESATEPQILRALYGSCFDEVLRRMPEGLDTVMAAGGANLSGGQRQRLSLARALCRQAGVYLLDDPCSALDARTAQTVLTRIREVLRGKTVIMVSQKISAIRGADRIIVLRDGRVEGEGTHGELLASCGEYRSIYETQHYLEREGEQ